MFGITAIHRVFALFAVRASGPLRRVSYQTSVLPVQVRAGTLVAASPTSESGNTIKFLPIGKSIVGGVVEHHPASVADIIQKTPLGRSAPAVSVIIQDHHPVGAKIGIKSIHIAALRRRNRQIDGKQSGILQDGLQRPVADGPVVVILPGDDQRPDRSAGAGHTGKTDDACQQQRSLQNRFSIHKVNVQVIPKDSEREPESASLCR